MAYAGDLKSPGRKAVWVRLPPRVPSARVKKHGWTTKECQCATVRRAYEQRESGCHRDFFRFRVVLYCPLQLLVVQNASKSEFRPSRTENSPGEGPSSFADGHCIRTSLRLGIGIPSFSPRQVIACFHRCQSRFVFRRPFRASNAKPKTPMARILRVRKWICLDPRRPAEKVEPIGSRKPGHAGKHATQERWRASLD